MTSYLTDPIAIMSALCLSVVAAEWLVHHTFFRHVGTALLVIVATMLLANLDVIPADASEPVYDIIFAFVAPLAIFLPLLEVNLRDVQRAGLPMIGIFLVGAGGTIAGVLLAVWVVDAPTTFSEPYKALGGMFVGTYIGGTINFNTLALHYGVNEQGVLFAGSTVADHILTALWIIATITLPRMLHRVLPVKRTASNCERRLSCAVDHSEDTETFRPFDLAALLALGGTTVWTSNCGAEILSKWGVEVPAILILTTLALLLAQVPALNGLKGSRVLGMFSVYLFLAVIGALCDFSAFHQIGSLGLPLLVFVSLVVFTHGVVTFSVGALLRLDWDLVAVSSQANVGNAISALALARSLGRSDLVLPGVLMGSLGYAIGSFLGFLTADYLL